MPRARRKVDSRRTLANYEGRLRGMPDEAFAALDDAWLESFDVYGVFREAHVDCPATRLMGVARERGARVHGVLSARTRGGRFLCETVDGVPRDRLRIVYVGERNYFSGRNEPSPFALRHVDKVFLTS